MFDLDAALRYLVLNEGSDLHLKVPSQPIVRVHGRMEPIEGSQTLTPEDTEGVVRHMLTDPKKLAEFESDSEVDFAYGVRGLGRFRVNAFYQRGSISLVLRAIPAAIKPLGELDLPPVIQALAEQERGIVLITGTTGSGKTTTLAAMIDHINRTMHKHVVTIEDPIEFLHRDNLSIINQREVGMDTLSFKRALRRVLRQDPDVILIGEMRDEETVQAALSAAETGHLVLSTLHTVDAPETINRIIDFFPTHQQQQARAMLAGTLQGIVSQRLVKTRTGHGRVACCEIMVRTGRVRDMILDPSQTGMLPEVLAEGEFYGMQTFDQALHQHLRSGRVSMEEALRVATSPHDFKLLVAADGRVDEEPAVAPEPPPPAPPAPAARHSERPLGPSEAARAAAAVLAGTAFAAAPAAPRTPAPGAAPARPASPPSAARSAAAPASTPAAHRPPRAPAGAPAPAPPSPPYDARR